MELKTVNGELQAVVDVTKWKPLENMVLVRRKPPDEKSVGIDGDEKSRVITGHTKEKSHWVQVVRLGEGRVHPETGVKIPMCPVKRGDWVICRTFEGSIQKPYLSTDGYEYSLVDDRVLELKAVKKVV